MMLSLSAIDMLLVSVIAFFFFFLSNIIALTLWIVNNETIDFINILSPVHRIKCTCIQWHF